MSSVYLPDKLDDLWKILNENRETSIMAGGTDLLVRMREKGLNPSMIAGLENISEMNHIELLKDEIRIGAMVTHQQLLESPLIQTHLPCLHQAAAVLGSPPIRHMGTIGGNICTASPAGDTLPPLYVLNAELELRTSTGSRILPIQDFIQGAGQTVLEQDEILYQIRIPIPIPIPISSVHTEGFYFKVGQRKALAIAITSMAALLEITEDQIITNCRFAWGSIGPAVMRFPEAEKTIIGDKMNENTMRKLGQSTAQLVNPINDIRATAEYRRLLVKNLPIKIIQEKLTVS